MQWSLLYLWSCVELISKYWAECRPLCSVGRNQCHSSTIHSTGILPCHQFQSVRTFYFKVQNSSIGTNSSGSVITASYSKWTKCHTSGYINSTAFGHKSLKSFLSTSQKLMQFWWLGQKNVYSFKSLSDAEELYFMFKEHLAFLPFISGYTKQKQFLSNWM